MGDTSSGKSSVLSALSGIQFPSSDVLTTRCPTQLILHRADKFSGRVHLQRYQPSAGNPEIEEGVEIQTMSDVTNAIERLTQQLVDEGQNISDDSIVIHLYDIDLPNLTLIDLPGLVRTVEDGEDRSTITRVRELVDRYVAQQRTIILAVVPANVDLHNIEILEVAEQADPAGDRTIGVITKPDLIDAGAERRVLELLVNQRKRLKLGYHMVKCRGQQDLNDNTTISRGIENERVFFRSRRPWCEEVTASLLGTEELQRKLSLLLESRVKHHLPEVCNEIREELKKCRADLLTFGPKLTTLTEKRSFYLNTIREAANLLENSLGKSYSGRFFDDGEDRRLRAVIRQLEAEFRDEISKTRQACIGDLAVGDEVEFQVSDNTWINAKITSKKSDMEMNIVAWFPAEKDPKDVGDDHYIGDTYFRIESETKNGFTASLKIDSKNFRRLRLKQDDILQEMNANRGNELPLFLNFEVFRALLSKKLQAWEAPTRNLFTDVVDKTRNIWNQIADHVSKNQNITNFLKIRGSCCIDQLETTVDALIEKSLNNEKMHPYTNNHYLFDIWIKLRNEPMLNALKRIATVDQNGKNFISYDAAVAIIRQFGVGNNSNEEREALEMQFALAAYLKVVRKRYTDSVPMLIQEHFIAAFCKAIRNKFEVVEDDTVNRLMEEDPVERETRDNLIAKETSLALAEKELTNFFQF